jgi:CheY-like chemotaxis protein/tRNA A-37 threonylcarbamoyl transferase component Bud32
MENLDATTLGQRILNLRLVTEPQLLQAREEAGEGTTDVQHLLRALERKGYLTPWQRDRVLKGDTDGYFLGGYRILYKIASGSFGRVFRADDPRTGRVVAIKVLRRRWSEDPRQIEKFLHEGKLGLTLKHPNIVEVLAISQDAASQQYYIVMEFVEGGNLREILAIRKKLSVAEALRIIEDASSGLAYAFSRGLTHRDIKLTNLLISSTGEAKLVDFGLAQLFSGQEKGERTVDYAGLERATNVKPGDTRSDIYFLGCILYECLTGRSPLLMTRDKHARMQKERFEKVPPMRPDEVDAPPSVFALVETMMSLSPARRYQTPSQLVDVVRGVRREVEGKGGGRSEGGLGARSVFVAESDERLQEALRGKFRELGFRVFLSADPARALDRYRQQPYDALIVDVGTTGEDGLLAFQDICAEAQRKRVPIAAVVILSEDQKDWAARVGDAPGSAVFVRPVTLKQVYRTLEGLMSS